MTSRDVEVLRCSTAQRRRALGTLQGRLAADGPRICRGRRDVSASNNCERAGGRSAALARLVRDLGQVAACLADCGSPTAGGPAPRGPSRCARSRRPRRRPCRAAPAPARRPAPTPRWAATRALPSVSVQEPPMNRPRPASRQARAASMTTVGAPMSGVLSWIRSQAPDSAKTRTSSSVLQNSSATRRTGTPSSRRAARSAPSRAMVSAVSAPYRGDSSCSANGAAASASRRQKRTSGAQPGAELAPGQPVDVQVQGRHVAPRAPAASTRSRTQAT